MRNNQTPDEPEPENEALPEIPPMPTLPDVPELKPNLPKPQKSRLQDSASEYQRLGVAYTIPIALITPILLLTLGGAWLDSRYQKSPWFLLGGALIGTIVGFINMIRIANKLNK